MHQAKKVEEKSWPYVVHAAACLTTQKPNKTGRGGVSVRKKPKLVVWVGSKKMKKYFKHVLQQENDGEGPQGFDLEVVTAFDSYVGNFTRADNP